MRSFVIALSLVFVVGGGVAGCKKKKAPADQKACTEAKAEAAEKWADAEKAWKKIAKAWQDPDLGKSVKKGIDKRAAAPGGDAAAKAAAATKEWANFSKYWEEKKSLASAAHAAAQKAMDAAKNEKNLKKARKAGYAAFAAAKAAQPKSWDKAPAWFSNPDLTKVDATLGNKAYTLSTLARSANKSAVDVCSK